MNILSHGLASVLIYRVLDIFAPNLFPHSAKYWYVIAFIFGIIPDIDVLTIKNFKDHHKSPTHWPIIWVSLLILTIIFQNNLSQSWFAILILFSSAVIVHICLDYISGRTAGVQLLFPFSKKEMSLYPLNKKKGSFSVKKVNKKLILNYVSFYTKNKALIAFELLIVLAGLVALIFR